MLIIKSDTYTIICSLLMKIEKKRENGKQINSSLT